MRNDPVSRWAGMFADADAGLFTLPPEIAELRAIVSALDAERDRAAAQVPDPAAARDQLAQAMHDAASGGQDWPDPAKVLAVERAAQTHAVRTQALDSARRRAAGELVSAVDDLADELIVEHLRPPFTAAVAKVSAAAEVLPADLGADALLRAPDKVRKTWLGLADVVSHLTQLRRHADALARLNPPRHDLNGEFANMRNLRQVWPLHQPGRTPPWPTDDARLGLLWQVRNGADLWLPTGAERDAAWMEVHGEGYERMRRARYAAGAVQAWGTGREPSPAPAPAA